MLLSRVWTFALCLIPLGCGARSALSEYGELPKGIKPVIQPVDSTTLAQDGGLPVLSCSMASECAVADLCVEFACENSACAYSLVDCDDGDPCTVDDCDPETGCVHTPVSRDEDKDGFYGPLPGFAPGQVGACGDDCDDASADSFPGNREVCDGVDNDCNGVVDDGATFIPSQQEPLLLSGGTIQASLGGFVNNGEFYAATGAYQQDNWSNSFMTLAADGSFIMKPSAISKVSGDTFSGPLLWTGSVFATAWEDRRDNDFEIYFNRIDAEGVRLGPDLRVTNAYGMSTRPSILWDGAGYVLVWNDERDDPNFNQFRIYGQRISADGQLLGVNTPLTPVDVDAEDPVIVKGDNSLALLFNFADSSNSRRVGFRTLGYDFSYQGTPVAISEPNSVGASLVYNRGRYISAWSKRDRLPGDAIYGAVVDPDGTVVIAEKRLTAPAEYARSHSILALGDRLLLLWAEYRDGSFDIYSKELTEELDELTAARQVTFRSGDAFGPAATFGGNGDVGVIYTDNSVDGTFQLYFTRLICDTGVVLR